MTFPNSAAKLVFLLKAVCLIWSHQKTRSTNKALSDKVTKPVLTRLRGARKSATKGGLSNCGLRCRADLVLNLHTSLMLLADRVLTGCLRHG